MQKNNFLSLVSVFFLFFSWNSFAQDFTWQADIPRVGSDSYYKIHLKPAVVSKLLNNFSDIRVFDENNNEIPYITEIEKPFESRDYFVEYKIIEKAEIKSWPFYTRLVIHNPGKNNISNIQLVIRNSDVKKTLKLSGSDDKVNWYSIRDGYRFQSLYSDNETSIIKILDFPVSNYEYYEIRIDDLKNNPLNIVKAGFYNTAIEKGKYTAVDTPSVSQTDIKDKKESLIKIEFPELTTLNKISLKFAGPEFFYREAELQVYDSTLNKRNKYEYSYNTLTPVIISSNSDNSWYFNNLTTKTLFIRIKNYDDAPLKIQSANAEQLNHYLIAKLLKSTSYKLKFGNKNSEAPNYDLKYFRDNIPAKLESIEVGMIKSLKGDQSAESYSLFKDRKLIWLAIILVALLLVFMISKMLKEMKSNKLT